jgi:hypothetical protein
MSFEEHPDCFIWRCNGKDCGKEIFFKPHDFFGCVAELKARGWTFHRYEDGDWSHTCAYCNHKHRQTDLMDRKFHSVK